MNKNLPEECNDHHFGHCCLDNYPDPENCYCGDCLRCGGKLNGS